MCVWCVCVRMHCRFVLFYFVFVYAFNLHPCASSMFVVVVGISLLALLVQKFSVYLLY